MKKLLLFLLVMLVGCSHVNKEQQVIGEFLSLKSELYQHQEEVADLMETMPMTDDFKQDDRNEHVLSNIKSKVDEEAFERLLANRMIIDESLMSGKYDKSEIHDTKITSIDSEEDNAVYYVTYREDLFKGGQKRTSQNKKFGFTLVKRDGQWKIFDIRPIEKDEN